jgi:hypothetical protein
MNGVAVLSSIWLGSRMGTVQKGDSVQPGVPFMQVVDPSQMEVRAMVSQSDLDRVHAGQAASAHFDAYPGMRLPAVLTEISPLGEQGKFSEKIRTFSALFAIQGNDPRLLPDLSAALDIVLQSSDSALVVPRNAVGRESSGDFVWVKRQATINPVKLGPISDTGRLFFPAFRRRHRSLVAIETTGQPPPMTFPWTSRFRSNRSLLAAAPLRRCSSYFGVFRIALGSRFRPPKCSRNLSSTPIAWHREGASIDHHLCSCQRR